jgi:hypothetical protein
VTDLPGRRKLSSRTVVVRDLSWPGTALGRRNTRH